MSADSIGALLDRVDERVKALLARSEAVLCTVVADDPLTVQLDGGQVVESPFVFNGGAPDVGARVVGLWLQGGHDLGLVIGGGSDWIPPFAISNLVSPVSSNGVTWRTPAWRAPKEIDLSGRTLRLSTYSGGTGPARMFLVGTNQDHTLQLNNSMHYGVSPGQYPYVDLPAGQKTRTRVLEEGWYIPAGSNVYGWCSFAWPNPAPQLPNLTLQVL